MKRWVPPVIAVIAFVVLLASGGNAWALGDISCDTSETSDFFVIENGGVDGTLIAIFVTATGGLFGGPLLDPKVIVRNAATGVEIACNDDTGSNFGPCSLANTADVVGWNTRFGSTLLFSQRDLDSLVIFVNPPEGARVEVTASDFPIGSDCGLYSVQILGLP